MQSVSLKSKIGIDGCLRVNIPTKIKEKQVDARQEKPFFKNDLPKIRSLRLRSGSLIGLPAYRPGRPTAPLTVSSVPWRVSLFLPACG